MRHSQDYYALSIADTMLRRHEGVKQFAYKCSSNFTTIGVGRNLDTRGLRPDEIELLLSNDLEECVSDLQTFKWWPSLSSYRKAALIDMRFCLGHSGFRAFRKMLAAIESEDWTEAANQLLDSRFAIQTGYRAKELARILETNALFD